MTTVFNLVFHKVKVKLFLYLIGGLISLWLLKKTTSYGIEKMYLLYILTLSSTPLMTLLF
jgi:hypothetical protein